MGCETQLAWKCIFMPTFQQAILTCEVGQTELVFGVLSGFTSRFVLQDYNSLCAAVTTCATLVGIYQTDIHRQHFDYIIYE